MLDGQSRTPNQVVAHNLQRARRSKGWTLEKTAAELAPSVGARWSRQNLSQLEQSAGGAKPRNFNADDLLAFSLAFELPITWFFIPPDHVSAVRCGEINVEPPDLLRHVFLAGWENLRDRLLELPETTYPFDLNTLAARFDLYMVERLSEIPDLDTQLYRLADYLGHARQQAHVRLMNEEAPTAPFETDPTMTLPTSKS
jgi:transcriptional regulator with XRE-family HTH domain